MVKVTCEVTADEYTTKVWKDGELVASKRLVRKSNAQMTGDRKAAEVEKEFTEAFGLDGGLELQEAVDELDGFALAQFLNENDL